MELGLAFDDEDLEENSNKAKPSRPVSYNAKFCPPNWFENADTTDKDTAVQILKYRGDHSYLKKEYTSAIDHYEEALSKLPENNKAMKRELMESQARSYVALQQYNQALHLAYQLRDISSSPDQISQTLVLLTFIQEASQDWPEFEVFMKELICCHPHSANLWRRLALCYWQLYRHNNQGSFEYCKLVTCLIRSRLLFLSVRRSVGEFVAKRHEEYCKEMEQLILELNASEELIHKAKKFLCHDMSKVEQQDGGDNAVQKQMDVKDFDKRWYSWTDNCLPT
ncbi:uncharacterized protein C8orf76 homolog [Ylistrum balloti]|uniref:uncharacterized protein C8orf76 homolog n=1 Tax=Ylistrum balloti TaxID=509963 RepID=UPI002905E21E|nr:uncharacterized protein C8orf76 homolog [Ylistrum balloti]